MTPRWWSHDACRGFSFGPLMVVQLFEAPSFPILITWRGQPWPKVK